MSEPEQLSFDAMPTRLFACTPNRLATFDCPRRYRFTYLDRPTPPRGAPWARSTVGAVAHLALQRWWALPRAHRTPDEGASLVERSWYDPSKARIPDPATLSSEARAVLRGNAAALALYGGTMTDPTLLGRLGAVSIPALVVWGEADRIADPEHGRAYAAAVPDARFVLLERTGHVPQLETPERLLDAIRDFVTA